MDKTIKNRKKGEEAKFKHDQEFQFKTRSRRNKLMGLWVAQNLGLGDDAALDYAHDLIGLDLEVKGDANMVAKIMADFAAAGVGLDEAIVTEELAKQEAVARQQISEEYPTGLDSDRPQVGG